MDEVSMYTDNDRLGDVLVITQVAASVVVVPDRNVSEINKNINRLILYKSLLPNLYFYVR